jgi:hypothetical protein
MALNSAGVSDISMEEILFQDVQAYLVQEAVIVNTITDLTPRVGKGMKSVKVPRFSGLSVSDVKQDGSEATASGMTADQDSLVLSSFREVPEFIYEAADLESAVDLKEQFLDAAPRVLGVDIESAIYAELKQASAATPDHIIQMSEPGPISAGANEAPSLADVQRAGLLLDEQSVPTDNRYFLVSNTIKLHLLGKTEIQDASKSGSNSALVNGEFAQLFGMKMIASNVVPATECVAYHSSACAFAMQQAINYIEEDQKSKGREFISVRSKYGTKNLDAGIRCVLLNTTGA